MNMIKSKGELEPIWATGLHKDNLLLPSTIPVWIPGCPAREAGALCHGVTLAHGPGLGAAEGGARRSRGSGRCPSLGPASQQISGRVSSATGPNAHGNLQSINPEARLHP